MVPHLLLFSCVIIHMSTALGKKQPRNQKNRPATPHREGNKTEPKKKNPQKNSSQPKQ